MKLEKDIVIFELTGRNKSNYEDSKTKQQARGLGAYSLTHTQTILYKDDEGDQWEREIRYIPSQSSIFVDQQNDNIPESQQHRIWRMVSKPQFVNGILMVKSNQKNLLKFLRSHPQMEGNEGLRTTPKQKTVFRERNAAKLAKEQNEKTKAEIKAEMLVFSAPFEEKILPIAKYLKFDVDQDAELILYNVKNYAVNNPSEFLELMDSPIVERVSLIEKAQGLGVLKVTGQRVLWADGRQIVDVPSNYDPVHYLAEVSFDDNYRTIWAEIMRLLDKRTNPKKDSETIAQAESTDSSTLDNLSAEELFTALKESGVMEWKAPYYVIGDERVGKGEKEAVKAIALDKKAYAVHLV